jgi:uncharacterized protein DUF839
VSQFLTRKETAALREALTRADLESQADWKPAKGRDPFATCVDRRAFLRGGGALFGGLALGGHLLSLMTRPAAATSLQIPGPYGPAVPTPDEATGLALIQLPPGFRYTSFGWTGDPMDNGEPTPNLHDGMAVVRDLGRFLLLVRNHETDEVVNGAFTNHPYSPDGGGAQPISPGTKSRRPSCRYTPVSAGRAGIVREACPPGAPG